MDLEMNMNISYHDFWNEQKYFQLWIYKWPEIFPTMDSEMNINIPYKWILKWTEIFPTMDSEMNRNISYHGFKKEQKYFQPWV